MKFYLFILLIFSFEQILAEEAKSWDFQAGLSVFDEGDDRFISAYNLHFAYTGYSLRYFYTNKEFGPVFQETHLLAVSKDFFFEKIPWVSLRLGLSPLMEKTSIKFDSTEDASYNRKDTRLNLGTFFGLFSEYTIYRKLKVQISWESALFPAGVLGGFLLATGRKQILSLSLGAQL